MITSAQASCVESTHDCLVHFKSRNALDLSNKLSRYYRKEFPSCVQILDPEVVHL